MSYTRFTKINIDYFMSMDQSISRRNKMFWHTARDDTMYTSMRCISRHEKTQVYVSILSKELTNPSMLESKAYQTYYAFASGEKAPKPKYVRKKADSHTSPKQKPIQATKGTRIKTKAKVAKSDKKKQPAKMPKAKGLDVLSKLATKRGKKDFHISHANGLGDGLDTPSKVPDEQQQKTFGADEGTEDVDEIVQPPSDYELTDDEKIYDKENIDEEEDDEVTKELYDDQEDEDAYVALIHVLDTQKTGGPTQSSSVSSDFTSKLLNLDNPSSADNEIASLMDTTAYHATAIPEIISSFSTTTPPPPPFFNPLSQQVTPTPTPTTSETTSSLHALPDFAYVFKFNKRVFNLEKDLSEIKQVDQYAQALSSIPTIVDRYMDNKLGEAISKKIIKEEVNAQLPQILPQTISDIATLVIEKTVTASLEAVVLTRSLSQPHSSYEAAATLFEFELTKILIDKMEKNKSFDVADYKRVLYDALVKSYNTDKDIFKSYGELFSLKMSRDERDKDRDHFAGSDRGTKRRKSSKDVDSSKDLNSKEKKSSSNSKDAF
nr:hypothetical protein [Tanacetum cinerariifolium]